MLAKKEFEEGKAFAALFREHVGSDSDAVGGYQAKFILDFNVIYFTDIC